MLAGTNIPYRNATVQDSNDPTCYDIMEELISSLSLLAGALGSVCFLLSGCVCSFNY